MPELPEVETIKNQLLNKIKDKTISKIDIIDYQKKVQGNKKNLLAKIINIQRRAKQLIFTLSNQHSFIIHLKLTGQLIYQKPPKTTQKKPQILLKYAKVVFTFQDHSKLFFNDFRKFGYLKIIKTKDLQNYLEKQNLGPEPLTLPLNRFQKLLQKKPRSKIKPVLLDQSFIAGLGNIYAQEACFKANINPQRTISSLTPTETKKLHHAIKTILRSAIKHQGTSFDTSYRTAENQPGQYEPYVKVYHRKICPKCKTHLKIIKQNSRSTYYCSKCQK